jgi:hypothetical protein
MFFAKRGAAKLLYFGSTMQLVVVMAWVMTSPL